MDSAATGGAAVIRIAFDTNIGATATKLARWMAYLGLGCGVLYSVGGLVLDLLTIGLNRGTALAFLALVGMPLGFGAFGFLAGALIALVSRSVSTARNRRAEQ